MDMSNVGRNLNWSMKCQDSRVLKTLDEGKFDSKKNIISSNQKDKAPPHGWVYTWGGGGYALPCQSQNIALTAEVFRKSSGGHWQLEDNKPVQAVGPTSQIAFETSWKWPKFCCAGILASVRDVRDYPKKQLSWAIYRVWRDGDEQIDGNWEELLIPFGKTSFI